MKVIEDWNVLPTEACEIISLEMLKTWIGKAFSIDAALKVTLARRRCLDYLEVPSFRNLYGMLHALKPQDSPGAICGV